MRPIIAILLALAPLSAQVARPVSANARVSGGIETAPPRVTLTSLAGLARGFDRGFRMYAVTDPIDVLGNTRGIYLDRFAARRAPALSPVFTPGLSPFQPNISQQDKEKVRQRKLARLPVVERLVNSMPPSAGQDRS